MAELVPRSFSSANSPSLRRQGGGSPAASFGRHSPFASLAQHQHHQQQQQQQQRRLHQGHVRAASGRLQPVDFKWAPGTPRLAGSFRPTANIPPLPLRLGPLVEALADGNVEGARESALDMRMALKGCPQNKSRLIQAGGIQPLVQAAKLSDPWVVEHAVTCMFNVCREAGAPEMLEAAGAFQVLVDALRARRPAACENSAAAIFCLCEHAQFRAKFVELGSIPRLLDLVRGGTVRGQKDGALALFNLLRHQEAAKELVDAGGVPVLLSLLQSTVPGLEEKAMAVLALVSMRVEGRGAIMSENALLKLVDVLELASRRAREDAVCALLCICSHDREALHILAQEGIIPAVHKVAQSTSERTRSKATALLQLLKSCQS